VRGRTLSAVVAIEEFAMLPRTFIVPLDGSPFAERALDIARAFARRVEGQVVLLSTPWDRRAHLAREYLDRVVARDHAVPLEAMVVYDRGPAEAISMVAAQSPDRIVCMTSHGRGGLRWAMVGSVAEEVIQRVAQPLLLVGRHADPASLTRRGPVLACVDGSQSSAAIAPLACEWARELGHALEVAVVVHPLDTLDAQHPDDLLEPIAEQFRAHGAEPHVTMLRSTYVAGMLADHANDVDASLVALTTRARTGAKRVVLGSVSMGVLSEVRSPVLIEHRSAHGHPDGT
jgi:nucleotide-binding universal stress UspA family protein